MFTPALAPRDFQLDAARLLRAEIEMAKGRNLAIMMSLSGRKSGRIQTKQASNFEHSRQPPAEDLSEPALD